ncbi:MAG: 2-C-methyl-D-erythritol 2,4-cyclodiphosphate synthase [Gammaproteobacteria bacterium]|nr:2-C-methyl-D-erythritol 2,4-cyclodiphosphate synthase [Gammaproteobacteria bacterium]
MMRIGHGYDIHRLEEDNNITKQYIILGGVQIPYERGIVAHSDGDVVIHAICDALLGACGLGDIGQHFPDTDPKYKNHDSREFLRLILQKVLAQGYVIGNVDVSIIAQAPKLAPHILLMRENLALDLQTSVNNVNVKATTHERLDAVGQKLGIAVHAVALLVKS